MNQTRQVALLSARMAAGMTAAGGIAYADPANEAKILSIERTMAAATSAPQVTKFVGDGMVFDDMTPGQVHGAKAFGDDIAAEFAGVKDLKVTILTMNMKADSNLAYASAHKN